MIYISTGEAASFYKCSKRTIQRKIRDNEIKYRQTECGIEIELSGADEDAYKSAVVPADQIDAELQEFNRLPGYKRAVVMEWEMILQMSAGLSGYELDSFCKAYKPKSRHIRLSASTLYRKRALYAIHGQNAIIPAWGSGGSRKITREQFDYFKNLYLHERGPSAERCRLVTFGAFKNRDDSLSLSAWPTARAFLARLRKHISEPLIDYARKGERYYKRNHEYFISRDWSAVAAGEWWVSDHHQLDVLCKDKNGQIVRPWVTAWMDLRSYKIVAAWLHIDAPNSDHIFMTFAWGVESDGLPNGVYLDNGKDYRSLDLSGNPKRYKYWNDESEHYARCLFGKFSIKTLFAREYNAQAKTIEPRFKVFVNSFSKFMPGYTGSDTSTRPDRLKHDIKNGKLLTFDQVEQFFNSYINDTYNNLASNGRVLNGLSPNQAHAQYRMQHIRKPSADSMQLLYMRSTATTVRREGIVDTSLGAELVYWSDDFYSMRKQRVYIRRDMRRYNIAYVYTADDDRFICCASLVNRMPGIAGDINKLDLKDAIRRKKRDLKLAAAATKTDEIEIGEIIASQQMAAIEQAGKISIENRPGGEIVVTTEFDTIKKEIKERRANAIDITAYVPDIPPNPEIDDIDLWGERSIAI